MRCGRPRPQEDGGFAAWPAQGVGSQGGAHRGGRASDADRAPIHFRDHFNGTRRRGHGVFEGGAGAPLRGVQSGRALEGRQPDERPDQEEGRKVRRWVQGLAVGPCGHGDQLPSPGQGRAGDLPDCRLRLRVGHHRACRTGGAQGAHCEVRRGRNPT